MGAKLAWGRLRETNGPGWNKKQLVTLKAFYELYPDIDLLEAQFGRIAKEVGKPVDKVRKYYKQKIERERAEKNKRAGTSGYKGAWRKEHIIELETLRDAHPNVKYPPTEEIRSLANRLGQTFKKARQWYYNNKNARPRRESLPFKWSNRALAALEAVLKAHPDGEPPEEEVSRLSKELRQPVERVTLWFLNNKPRTVRHKWSDKDTATLEAFYQAHPDEISLADIERLAIKLGQSYERVRVWFQHRRAMPKDRPATPYFSENAVAALEALYQAHHKEWPPDVEIERLATQLGKTIYQVECWFQRRINRETLLSKTDSVTPGRVAVASHVIAHLRLQASANPFVTTFISKAKPSFTKEAFMELEAALKAHDNKPPPRAEVRRLSKKLGETFIRVRRWFWRRIKACRTTILKKPSTVASGIDSSLADNFGRTIITTLSAVTTIVAVSFVGGLPFVAIIFLLAILYYNMAKVYGKTSRDMRRLDSVSRSPLYSVYGETISGVPVLRAFGASSKLLRYMLQCVDTNTNPYYWLWGVNRWLSIRSNLLSSAVVVAAGLACLVTPSISASLAGFALAFASTITNDLRLMIRRFVGLEQSMVALERIKEYSELKREPAEFIEPRPAASWPSNGEIKVEDLVIRYAPDLPDVLHKLSFTVHPGEKVGILGRTGSGKSTLALSLFRFVEPNQGRILVDDVDITTVGLTDLRSRITIIPQDPTILSGTLRSTLDVFDEYEDAEIYEALRKVHLIPDSKNNETPETVNANVFRDLESPVSEGGENFSTGEKQLLCMARAILKRSKILVMDEATASVDYATDELIGKTVREGFGESTILTVAHRIRTIIDYDRVILLDQGRILELDKPKTLLQDKASKFYALCQATGKEEFSTLLRLAGVS
ncbi:hypothetical protein BKA70DRAFT_1564861 [Coprinopsis sp. MPI-PUGE-AT-0042]|nr:hypothetical protein BKA70DRAFT_1564861 [Coprinopsis sp. MPI-PUGE-AT-0042]